MDLYLTPLPGTAVRILQNLDSVYLVLTFVQLDIKHVALICVFFICLQVDLLVRTAAIVFPHVGAGIPFFKSNIFSRILYELLRAKLC